ncbi:hypothetical protein KIM372_13220 [Bombiscardovia nodaiensis]|uniref:Uncharacterized protein n=1 Tax=Bombiscardovia nodaiensis TaxID=2932181 RepID=A0ABM8B949_9BIFI|nr:hypothetical protein KIM372_13220 [Bombiscardovia nodaiensis]
MPGVVASLVVSQTADIRTAGWQTLSVSSGLQAFKLPALTERYGLRVDRHWYGLVKFLPLAHEAQRVTVYKQERIELAAASRLGL